MSVPTEDYEGVILPQKTQYIRCRVYTYKDPVTEKIVRDCSATHAVITVRPSFKRWTWKPIQIGFWIGQAGGDFRVADVIEEFEQWQWSRSIIPTPMYTPFEADGVTRMHEWWAARAHAIKAIELQLRNDARAYQKHQRREAEQKQRLITKYGGEQQELF